MIDDSTGTPQVHWLFKTTPGGLACLGIEVLPGGDYWVYDSPTGTYAAGHAEKGKWREVYDQYLADGYVPEAVAKAHGLVPVSWSRQPPRPPWAAARRITRLRLAGLALLALLGTVLAIAWR
jgi:hypothetical protein